MESKLTISNTLCTEMIIRYISEREMLGDPLANILIYFLKEQISMGDPIYNELLESLESIKGKYLYMEFISQH